MITKYIEYAGKKSKDVDLRLVDDIVFSSPEKHVDFLEIDGVDGEKIQDKQRLKVVNRSFPFVVYDDKQNIEQIIKKLNEWLINTPTKWHDFGVSWDSDYLYKALFFESFDVEGSLKARKKCVLNFKVHPIKFLKSGLNEITVRSGDIVNNPEKRKSKPLIKLTGTGDVDLMINTQLFKLKGVSGHIYIDCESQSAYYQNQPQYDKVYSYPFPQLDVGNNRISWNNSNFSMKLVPRWEAIVT